MSMLEDNIKNYNFLMICNNYIVNILKQADKEKWADVNIDFKEIDKKKYLSDKYDILYFRNHGYATVINASLYKHIILSLISDYNIYIEDVIDCCLKEHFSTAYTLMRKPLKDDLFMIELFYASGHRIISKFANGPIENFCIEKYDDKEKKKVLRKVCYKIGFFTGKRLFDLRYSQDSYGGLEQFWNKAIHIVTTRKNRKTENFNFNMIFYNDDVVNQHITYIYNTLSCVQLYFIVLILNILLEEKLITEDQFNFNKTNIFIAFFSSVSNANLNFEEKMALSYKCKYCGKTNNYDSEQRKYNYDYNKFELKCNYCDRIYSINGFDFLNNNL